MKHTLLSVLFACSSTLLAQTGTAYTLTVHVMETRLDQDCGVMRGQSACEYAQTLRVTIDGRKFELRSETLRPKGLVALGDYQARLADDQTKPTGEFTREYTLRLRDGSTRTYQVISEHE